MAIRTAHIFFITLVPVFLERRQSTGPELAEGLVSVSVRAMLSSEASCGHSKRDLLRRLLVVALPSYPITLVTRCVGLVSTSMVGRHVKDMVAIAKATSASESS